MQVPKVGSQARHDGATARGEMKMLSNQASHHRARCARCIIPDKACAGLGEGVMLISVITPRSAYSFSVKQDGNMIDDVCCLHCELRGFFEKVVVTTDHPSVALEEATLRDWSSEA